MRSNEEEGGEEEGDDVCEYEGHEGGIITAVTSWDTRDPLDDAKTGETRTPRDYQTAIKRPWKPGRGSTGSQHQEKTP